MDKSIIKKILQRSSMSLPTKYMDLKISREELYEYYAMLKEQGYIDYYVSHDGTIFGEDPSNFKITPSGERYLEILRQTEDL